MDLGGGKPIERLDNRLVRKLERVLDGGAFDHVGRHGACGDRCAAAERFKLRVLNHAVFDLQIHFHDIAAFRVADLADAVGIFNFTDIVRVGEMLQNFIRIQHIQQSFPYIQVYRAIVLRPFWISSQSGEISRVRVTIALTESMI